MQANTNRLLLVDNAYYSLLTIFIVLGDLLLTSESTNILYFIIYQTLYYQKQMKFLLSNRSDRVTLTVSLILLLSKRHFYVYIVGYLQPH